MAKADGAAEAWQPAAAAAASPAPAPDIEAAAAAEKAAVLSSSTSTAALRAASASAAVIAGGAGAFGAWRCWTVEPFWHRRAYRWRGLQPSAASEHALQLGGRCEDAAWL
eukprot:TRINITY_DN21064_c0_g2_i1.p1 TRINITY_DN21064_c0_g2~~TRINITY_DN21064_c0_g2_i1.p1  ORF type:complete len:110 (-),score=24.96 TRINITY_DN21064_c0_g2_i1:229-558(-)